MSRLSLCAPALLIVVSLASPAEAQPVTKSTEPVPYPGGPAVECAIAAAAIATLAPMVTFDPILRGTGDADTTDCTAAFTTAQIKLRAFDPGDRKSVFTLLSRPLRLAGGNASIDMAAIGPGYRKSETYVLTQTDGKWTVVSSQVNAES